MSFSFKADNELITAIRDRAMFNTFAGNHSYVIKGIGQELAVTVTPSTLNVSVGSGEAVICGGSTIIDSDNSLTLGANESGYLVIRIDLSQTQENICQFMKVPTLIQQNINNGTDLIYDLPLYQYTTNTSTVTSLVDIRSIRDYADTSLDGGTTGQVLTKNSNNNGDFGWADTDYMEVDTLGTHEGATPINADLLEGHSANYFQQKLLTFIDLGLIADLNLSNYETFKKYVGYTNPTSQNRPDTAGSGFVITSISSSSFRGRQIYFSDQGIFTRMLNNNAWDTNWRQLIKEDLKVSYATINSSYFSSGTCEYFVVGNVCFVSGYDLILSQNVTGITENVITGLPTPKSDKIFLGKRWKENSLPRMKINSTGGINFHFQPLTAGTNQIYFELQYIIA